MRLYAGNTTAVPILMAAPVGSEAIANATE